jgi:hypothetical protein
LICPFSHLEVEVNYTENAAIDFKIQAEIQEKIRPRHGHLISFDGVFKR